MRKFFSLIAAVLFAGSMMAAVTITPANCGWTASQAKQSGTVEGVTIAATSGYAAKDQQIRIYQGATLTISAETNIASIEFTCAAEGTAKYGPAGFPQKDGYSYQGAIGTWEGSATSVSMTTTAQVRALQIVVRFEGEAAPVKYYVAGTMTGWVANEKYKLAENAAQEGEYMGAFNFAANDEFKVIGVSGNDTTWYPQGTGNNWVINEAGKYTVYFRPAGNADWANKYFYVAPYVVNTYNVAEAIAAGLKENDEIMVRGIVTKLELKGKNFASYGSVNIYVADATGAQGTFEFYNCYSFNADTFKTTSPAYDATSTAWAEFKKVADGNGNEIRLGDTILARGLYKLYGTTYELNTGCYIVENKPAPVKPADTINISMSEGLIYNDYVESEGWWQIYGGNAQYAISVSNVATTQAAGTYTMADLDPDFTYVGYINGTDTSYVYFVEGSVTLSIAQNGDVTVAGQLVGEDDNIYNLNLVFVAPKAKEEVNVIITDGELYDEYADYGLYGVYGADNNNVYVQLAIWAKNGLQGQFTNQDLDFQYIGSYIEDGNDAVEIYTASITVTPGNNGNYNIVATILGYNNKQYNIVMTVSAATTGIEETFATGKASKMLRNGMLVIKKADKTFNAMGQEIR